MPRCGSQILLCDVPVRFDTYRGCSHGCTYCFTARKVKLSDIKPGEERTITLTLRYDGE